MGLIEAISIANLISLETDLKNVALGSAEQAGGRDEDRVQRDAVRGVVVDAGVVVGAGLHVGPGLRQDPAAQAADQSLHRFLVPHHPR